MLKQEERISELSRDERRKLAQKALESIRDDHTKKSKRKVRAVRGS